jgi:hypothetical protein
VGVGVGGSGGKINWTCGVGVHVHDEVMMIEGTYALSGNSKRLVGWVAIKMYTG